MRFPRFLAGLMVAVVCNASVSHAQQTILFNTDPFAGSNAADPGRQIVGGELFTTFNPATDVFSFDAGVFGIGSISFFNGIITSVPTTGVNTVVLQSSDVPFAAGIAANQIAGRITSPGAGFFLYYNTGLGVARLVYSKDLSDETADLKILARLTDVTTAGALSAFTAANFQIASTTVPEPSSILLVATGLVVIGGRWRLRRMR